MSNFSCFIAIYCYFWVPLFFVIIWHNSCSSKGGCDVANSCNFLKAFEHFDQLRSLCWYSGWDCNRRLGFFLGSEYPQIKRLTLIWGMRRQKHWEDPFLCKTVQDVICHMSRELLHLCMWVRVASRECIGTAHVHAILQSAYFCYLLIQIKHYESLVPFI